MIKTRHAERARWERSSFLMAISAQEGEQIGALLLDFASRAGMVKGDDLGQGRAKLLAGLRVLVVQDRGVDVPARGNVADGQPVIKTQAQQLDPAHRFRTAFARS